MLLCPPTDTPDKHVTTNAAIVDNLHTILGINLSSKSVILTSTVTNKRSNGTEEGGTYTKQFMR